MSESQKTQDIFREKHISDILIYNYQPLFFVHESWLDRYITQKKLIENLNPKDFLAQQWAIECFNLPLGFETPLENSISKLFFLSNKQLEKLMLWLGVVVYSDALCNMVWKKERENIRSIIGDDGYDFAYNQVKFIISKWPEDFKKKFEGKNYKSQLYCAGLEFVATLMQKNSNFFVSRFRLKLNCAFIDHFVPIAHVSENRCYFMFRILCKVAKFGVTECMDLLK